MTVSLILLSYKQEAFIADAVRSVLAQNHLPLEIILSDDNSPDNTYEIMKDVVGAYKGAAEVKLRRNSDNLGISAHFNLLFGAARGDVVVVSAGDDISLPQRVGLSAEKFALNKEVSAISLQQSHIGMNGEILKSPAIVPQKTEAEISFKDYLLGRETHPPGASRAYSAAIFDAFGPIEADCPTEDTPMLFRALLMGAVYSCPEKGIFYRRHSESLSAKKSMKKMDFSLIRKQHFSDLDTARKLGLVDRKSARDLQKYLSIYWARRTTKSIRLNEGFVSSFLNIVKESNVPISHKAGLLKMILPKLNLKGRF